jgi:hypothetical protein
MDTSHVQVKHTLDTLIGSSITHGFMAGYALREQAACNIVDAPARSSGSHGAVLLVL